MIVCALIGGPLASTAYVAALQMGGSIIVPICALNASFGAIIGHFVFKQAINRRMIAGILLCLIAAGVIGGTSFPTSGLLRWLLAVLPCFARWVGALKELLPDLGRLSLITILGLQSGNVFPDYPIC